MNNSDQSSGWLEQRGFGGLDWASQKHSVVVVDPQGKVIEDFEIEHSALGWKKFRERIKPYGSIPFAIETSQGAAVEQLFEAGMQVYPLNPKSAQAYRERKAPSGVKDDRLDAWSFADACHCRTPTTRFWIALLYIRHQAHCLVPDGLTVGTWESIPEVHRPYRR